MHLNLAKNKLAHNKNTNTMLNHEFYTFLVYAILAINDIITIHSYCDNIILS